MKEIAVAVIGAISVIIVAVISRLASHDHTDDEALRRQGIQLENESLRKENAVLSARLEQAERTINILIERSKD
jgi:hypothetical protein